MAQEQRKEPRFATDQTLWCEGQDRRRDSGSVLHARNVSKGGLFISGVEVPHPGETITIRFVTDEEPVAMRVHVVWQGKDLNGLEGVGAKIVTFEHGQGAYRRFVETLSASEAETSADIDPDPSDR